MALCAVQQLVSGCAGVVTAGSNDGRVDILWYLIVLPALLTWWAR